MQPDTPASTPPQRQAWETPILVDLSTEATESGNYVDIEVVRGTPSNPIFYAATS